MELSEYQKQALLSVAIKDKNLAALAHRSLGLTGEAGETANVIKKVIRDKEGNATNEDIETIAEKLGDTMYYIAVLAAYFNLPLDQIAAKNLEKAEKFRKSRS